MIEILLIFLVGVSAGAAIDENEAAIDTVREQLYVEQFDREVSDCLIQAKVCSVQGYTPARCQAKLEECTLTAYSKFCSITRWGCQREIPEKREPAGEAKMSERNR